MWNRAAARGLMPLDELYTNEWMFVQHFHFNMYVYQYATSQTAGTALYRRIIGDGEDGVENYKNLLRAGSSDYPYRLLAQRGRRPRHAGTLSRRGGGNECHHG